MKRPESRTFPISVNPAHARRANSLLESPAANPNFRAEKWPSPNSGTRRAAIPDYPPQKTAAHFGEILSDRRAQIQMPRRKKNSRRPTRAQSLNRGVRAAADNLRNRLYRRPPTAQEYAFGLFPRRRRLSWRTGGWRNILRRARRAPRKRGRPFAG